MPKVNNSPTNWMARLEADREANSGLLTMLNHFRQLPPVHKNEPEQIQSRLDEYFKACSEAGAVPTIESMSLALGVSRISLWKWANDDNSEAGQIIARAREMINATIATATAGGKLNAIYSIWLQKNHFNYSDVSTLQLDNITEKQIKSVADLPQLGSMKAIKTAADLPQLTSNSTEESCDSSPLVTSNIIDSRSIL